jgi:intein/homing endonuclease
LGFSRTATQLHDKVRAILTAIGCRNYSTDKGSIKSIVAYSASLSRFLPVVCGNRATTKKIPDFILLHTDLGIVRAFLDGYLAGDGHMAKDGHVSANTVSKTLAMQLQLLYARLGIPVGVMLRRKGGVSYIRGRKVTIHDSYAIYSRLRAKNKRMKVLDRYILTPISKVERFPYGGEVCNIHTGDDTYLVSNVVTHNCGNQTKDTGESAGITLLSTDPRLPGWFT